MGISRAASTSRGKENMVILVRKKELFVDHDEETPMLLLAYCFNTNPTNSSISPLISYVMQDYEDVFSKELPQGLPPLQGIEH